MAAKLHLDGSKTMVVQLCRHAADKRLPLKR